MRSNGTALLEKFNITLKEILRLISISHNEEDYSSQTKILGGEIEKFLKDSVYLGVKNNQNFMSLIDDLNAIGIEQNHIESLHSFRIYYNNYKHNPSFTSDILECKKIVESTIAAIVRILATGIGKINQPYIKSSKRIIWLAAWDDYLGGMSEIAIFPPNYSVNFPPSIEVYNIDFSGWDKLKDKFVSSGELKLGREFISEIAYDSWSKEGDFINAGVFNGDVADLFKEISSHINSKKEDELLPSLKRENDFSSVKSSFAFAVFDCLKNDSWLNHDDLIDEIKLRCSYDYGINLNSLILSKICSSINKKISEYNRTKLSQLQTIIWTDEIGYEKANKDLIVSESLYLSISENNLLLRIK